MNTSYADLPSGDGQIQPGLFPSYGTNGSSNLGDAPLLPSDGFNNYVLDEEKKKEQKLSDESHKNLFAAEDFLASISPPSIDYKDGSGINIDLSSDSQIKLGDNAIKETSDFPEYNSSVEALFYDMPESAKIDRRNVYSKYFNPDGTAKQMEQFTEFLSKKKVDRNNNPSAAETHMYEYIANYANYIDFIDDLPAERKAAKKEALINAASDEINRLRSLQAVRNAGVGVIKSFTGVEDKVYFRYLDQSNIEVSILGDDGSVVKDDPSKTFTIKVPEVSKKKLSEYPIKDKFVEENLKKENKLKYKSESFPDIYDYFGVGNSTLSLMNSPTFVDVLTESDYVAYEKAKAAAEVGLFRDATPIEYAEREVRKALNDRNIQVGTMSYVKDLGYGALSALGQLQLFNRKISGIEGILRKAGRNEEADAFLEESKDAAEGINIVRGSGSNLINPSEAQRIFSGSAKVVGEMVPTILVSIASRNPGALTEPFVSSLARMSPIAMQSYGQAYFERLSEADRLRAQADDLRAAGKSEDANRLYSESERLNSTAEVNAMMTAAREWGTEMIIPEHKIFSGTMKATFGNVAMSAALNPIEDIAADLLSVPQASLVGDLKPNLNLKETALISAVSAFGMSAPPAIASAAYSGANTIIGNVPLNLDLEKFGPSRNEVHSPVATSTNVGEFIKDKVEFPIQSPDQETTPYSNEDNLPSVTDENGSVFTKRGNSFISKSGNEIPIRESGKGHDLMVLLEESDPNWSEKEDNAVGLTKKSNSPASVQPSSFQDLTFRQAIDASIAEEFPSYDGVSNKKVVDSIEKTLHPASYVWERFRDAGGKIKFNKSGRSSLYFDRSSNTLNVGLSNLSARKKGAIERWIAPAIQEEMDHFVISQAGINTRTIADLAPDEVRDAARLVYGKSYVNEDHEGDEILRMFMQGRIVKTNTGEWSIDGKSITESSAKGFFRVAKDAMATLVNSFSSVDADGETEFHKELSSAYSAASEKFQKIFGVPIEDHILSKELSMTSFSFRVKRSLYKMASSIGTLGDFAEEIISRLDRAGEDITPGKMDSIEKIGTLAMAAGKMSHPIDVSIDAILEDSKSGVLPNISVIDSQLSANNDSDSAGIVGSLKSKISMLKEALTNRANIASKEIVIKMGLFYNNVSSLIKWAGDLLGRGLSAVEKRLISLLSSVASSVAKLFKSFKSKAEEKPDDKKKDFIRMTWEFISASPALFSALVASTNGFTSFNEDAYNEVYRPLNIGQFSKVGKTAILLLELEKDIYNKRNEILGKIKSLSPDTMVIGRDDVAALHLLGEGDILFSLSPIGENVRAALTKKGVSIVVPNLSAIDTEGLGSKQWEQVVLGESGIKTVNVADTVMDILSNERPDLLERMEALEKEMNDAGENEEAISAVREKMKIVSSEMEAHYSGAEFQKKLRDEIVLAVGSENFVLKPVDGANSLGIRELNDRLQSDGFINPSFDGIDVIAQEYLDLDRKKSFRVHALNDNGRWHIVPASTFSRDVNDSGDYSLFPIVGGEYLNDAADAEEAALRILSSISDKQMDDRLLSLDLEWDNKLKSYRIMELNPTLGHGLGGYVGNFFVLDALVSMFTGKVPEMIKLAARSAEFNFDTGLRESSDADVRKNIPAVILPNRRTQAQRVAATHTYEKYPDVAKIVKDTYVRFLSERDKSTFDSLVNKNLNVDENDIPAIKKLLGDIKLRSDIEWFKAAQVEFPEVLAGKELSEFNNDPREVRVEIRRAFTYEPGDDSAGNPYDAAFSRSDKNRKKNEEKVLSISSGIFERLQSFANDPDSEFSSFTKEQQAKIANGVALLVGTDLSSLSNKDLSRLKATLLNVAEGDFLGFHDLVSKFHAMNFAAYLSSLVSSGGDIFSDPSYKPNRALYTKGARIKSIFRSIEANAFFDHVYMRYMADKAKYHSDIYSADRRIRIFFDQNKTSVDESLAAGIAAVLTQYIADNDSIELFEKKLRDVRHSISNMQGELADVSVRVKGGAASAILQRLLSGIDFSTLVNASDARAIIEKNLTRAERKVLDFARREFAKNKSQIKYIKTVVFGEKFDDIENYVHLMVRSVNFSPDEKGNVTKALGTQESALKDRRGLSNDGLTYYDMDIGTMLFDGQSDHMYEINTAEHRLILSHLHPGPVAQSSLSKGYAALFAGKRDVAQNRYIELSNVLREIHSSVTTAAFVPNGMLGVALRGVERGATFINALKLIDPRNIGAQFASAAIGLGAYIVSGKIRPSSFGMAMLFVGANFKPQRNNVKNILRGIVPGIVSRSENPDAQFDFTREASPRSFQVNTRLHKSIVRKSIAAIERAIQFPVSVVENIVTGAARFINGSPDGAIASIIFLSSYVNNYENITGKKISSPTDLEAILSDPNFDAVYKATTDVDSIMGNPSDPEMRGKMFEGKTFSARIIKSAMLLFRQTQIGISSNSISGLKTAIASGDNASKSGLANRFHGAVDFVQGAAQFVVFDLIKRWSYPALITAAIISLFKKDDDELNDVEKAARDSALNVAIKLKEARANLEARQAIKSVVFSQDNNLKYSRRKLLEYIQNFFPVVNNDAGDVAGNFLIDSYYGDSSRDFWIQQEAKIAFDIATITARKPKDKKEADENSRLLLGLRAMLELAKSEKRSSLPGASERMAKHGGSYSSFMELVSMAYEMQSDGPFLKKLRRAFFTRIPVFRDAVTAVEKAEEKTSESVLEKNNKKRMETELKIDALRYLKQ